MGRREYDIKIEVNGRLVLKVIIDPHYELKHTGSVDDELILKLVRLLDGGTFPPVETKKGFEYYVTDKLKVGGKFYKLIWLLEDYHLYIGIVNAHRSK